MNLTDRKWALSGHSCGNWFSKECACGQKNIFESHTPIRVDYVCLSIYWVQCFIRLLEEVGDRTMVTLSRSYHGGLTPGVMADQRKALADTTELTDRVYFVHPTRI